MKIVKSNPKKSSTTKSENPASQVGEEKLLADLQKIRTEKLEVAKAKLEKFLNDEGIILTVQGQFRGNQIQTGLSIDLKP